MGFNVTVRGCPRIYSYADAGAPSVLDSTVQLLRFIHEGARTLRRVQKECSTSLTKSSNTCIIVGNVTDWHDLQPFNLKVKSENTMSNGKLFLNHSEIASWVKANGRELTAMIGGEMGIGKTAIARQIAKDLGMDYTYIDCANMSLGDTSMPVVDRESRCTQYYPNEVFKLHTGRPVILCIDEYTKGTREAQNMLLPVIEDHRLGSTHLHPDSIVIATGNMPDEGLGDKILPHQTDRFVLLNMAKPTPDAWLAWAADNNIDPTVMAFVDQFPDVLKSYHDDKDGENKYIFHPRVARNKVVTPRSLEKASTQLKRKELVSSGTLHASLQGTVGSAAAADLLTFVNMNDKLPHFSAIVAAPTTTPIPKDVAARILLVYNMIMRVEKDNLAQVVQYIERPNGFPQELQGLFVNKVLSTPSKASWAALHKSMGKYVTELKHLFRA